MGGRLKVVLGSTGGHFGIVSGSFGNSLRLVLIVFSGSFVGCLEPMSAMRIKLTQVHEIRSPCNCKN